MNESLYVYVLPAANRNNVYIELFKKSLIDACPSLRVVDLPNNDIKHIVQYVKSDRVAKHIVHVHWPTILYGSAYSLKSLYLLTRNAIVVRYLKRCYGVRVVWTVHNTFSHDYPHPWIDRIGTALVRRVADCVQVQQQSTKTLYSRLYPTKRVEYIPHGNYIGVYGPIERRNTDLRTRLGFEKEDIVLLSLGVIAPYKRNEALIQAVLSQKNERVKLLIAGKGDVKYVETLKRKAGDTGRIVITNAFVDHSSIPAYMSIADFAVFFYDDSEMTSGGMILALSYGVPVITRAIPAAEVIGETNGKVFADEAGLARILEELKLNQYDPTRIMEGLRGTDWSTVGRDIVRVYTSLS